MKCLKKHKMSDVCRNALLEIILCVVIISGCTDGRNNDGHNGASMSAKEQIVEIGEDVVFPMIPMLDSVETSEIFDSILCSSEYSLDTGCLLYDCVDNLRLLPYLLTLFKDKNQTTTFLPIFIDLCSEVYADRALFEMGREIIIRNDYQEEIRVKSTGEQIIYKYESSFPSEPSTRAGYKQEYSMIDNVQYGVDSLRVRVIVHNDREALAKLERYYHEKGDDKGVAIYYKVMLGNEGNGDLAERFYRVLEPYFDATPAFRNAVREVLLRAAHCDHDSRAQELCDSLGFSPSDYRLPVIDED